MGFWDFLDDGQVRGKYETNFFHIYIYRDLPSADFWEYEDAEKGTFMHEYLHYIQFVTTIFGISNGAINNNYFAYCVDYFSKNKEIEIPLAIASSNAELNANISRYKDLKGSASCSIEIDQIVVERIDIDLAKKEYKAIKALGKNSQTGESSSFEFGYLGIIENMAIIFQSFFDKNLPGHSVVPYGIVEIICGNLQTPITDKRLLFSICLCSLMFGNPACGFFDVLDIMEKNPNYDGIKLYKHVLSGKIKHETCETVKELFDYSIKVYEDNIKAAVCGELIYYSKVFDNCKHDIQNNENTLLRLLYEKDISSKEAIQALTNHYGLPFIEANNLTIMAKIPNETKQGYTDIANLLALEMIIKRFTSKDKKCHMFERCYKLLYNENVENKFQMSEECEDEQWKKTDICFMTNSLKKYKLNEKSIIQL